MTASSSLRRRQGGFTLGELAFGTLAMLVVAGFIVGIFSGKIMDRLRAWQELTDIPPVLACARNRAEQSGSFSGITAAGIKTCFPNSMYTTTAINHWSQTITVAAATTSTANDSITFTTSYPQDGCVNVVTGLAAAFGSITVNGTAVKTIGNPLDVWGLEAACVAGNGNTVMFLATK